MKELFREPDVTRIGYLQSILESEGIPTHIRNQSLAFSGLTEIPIPEFFPALCVTNDDDYDLALEVIRKRLREDSAGSDTEIKCPKCGESNPGNFDYCWSCQQNLSK